MRTKIMCTFVFGGILIMIAIPQLATAASKSKNSTATITIPVQKWAKAYVLDANSEHYVPHTQLNLPLLWFYNSKGKPVKFFMTPGVERIKEFLAQFPKSLEHTMVLSKEPDLVVMSKVLHESGANSFELPAKRQYTALLLIPAEGCSTCKKIIQEFQAIVMENPDSLSYVIVKLSGV